MPSGLFLTWPKIMERDQLLFPIFQGKKNSIKIPGKYFE